MAFRSLASRALFSRAFTPSIASRTVFPFDRTFRSSARCFSEKQPQGGGYSGAGNQSLILTSAGPDRPGIVHDLAKQLVQIGANIEESRMTILGNDFAIIMRVTSPSSVTKDAVVASIQKAFPEFLVGARATGTTTASFPKPVKILQMQMEGPDQPGIVKVFTGILVGHGVSVRDLDTDTGNAPFAGYKVFSLKGVLAIPVGTDEKSLQSAIAKFEEDYGFDVEIQENDEGEQNEEGQENEHEHEEEEEPEPEPEPVRRAPARGRK